MTSARFLSSTRIQNSWEEPVRSPELGRDLPQDYLIRVSLKPLGRDLIYFDTTKSRRCGYPPILMKLPDDLAVVFTTKASSSHRSRWDLASASMQSCFREVGVILQPLGTVSTEELDSYLSSPGVDSQPTEILDYDDFRYNYDFSNLDDFDDGYEDNYTPLFFGVFMADNETTEQRQLHEAEEQPGRRARELIGQQDVEGTAFFLTPQQNAIAAITLWDTLLQEDAPNHVLNIINQMKTMIAASDPVNLASVCTPTGSQVPPLRSQDYHQPSLSMTASGSNHRSRDYAERSVHSPADRYRERCVEQPRSPRRRQPVDLRETLNRHLAERGYQPYRSPNRYDDDEDGVASFTSDLCRVDWSASFKLTGIEKYDGKTNGESWLTVYGLAIHAAGGDSKAMANYLPLDLVDSARSWLYGLPRGTIGSWAELHEHFITNFQGTFERPGTHFDLYNFAEKYAKQAKKAIDGDQSTSKKKDDKDDGPTGFQDSRKELNHIFGGPQAYESKRKQKLIDREINAVQPDTPQYLRWSETTIKFDHSDHPNRVVHPGWYPLITLLVTFGTQENFRTENICFDVADFETVYHAILGRLALAKFMVVPHYTYMIMKMPGPRGVISLRSNIKQAITCDKESCEMAQTCEITLARDEIRLATSTATEEVPATKLSKIIV
uniref:Retrotransposon protein, putative, Ty3-gypsy subclass n=1 Tax=Oryza sativa subsp. japonica TaxID=39947 RepID=Q33A70_ORYSJ|nr:retrotransposon protein, putative, Ty3-gypsy subclass [Oryza sativa Japonica Group]